MHGNGDGGNPVESAGNPQGWGQSFKKLRESRGDGSQSCGVPAGMEKTMRESRGVERA